MSTPIYDIPVETISGESTSLAAYRGKVLLVVNVASKCGLTPQYDALEKLYTRFEQSGLVVLGFPANDFAGQEPGSNDEIATFCRATFGVNFPMFSKVTVTGPAANPLYKALVAAEPKATGPAREGFRERLTGFLSKTGATTNPEPGILWNFEKFLIDRQGLRVSLPRWCRTIRRSSLRLRRRSPNRRTASVVVPDSSLHTLAPLQVEREASMLR